jgi:uncharacterized protein (DUF983 family)
MNGPDLASGMAHSKGAAPHCPSCSRGSGRLFSVALKGSVRTMTYQCESCKQQWPVSDYCPGPNDPPSQAHIGDSENE